MLKISKPPLLVFGLGVAAGFIVYKNRQIIIDSTTKTVETDKNILLEQKEKLLDLVAEAKEKQ